MSNEIILDLYLVKFLDILIKSFFYNKVSNQSRKT